MAACHYVPNVAMKVSGLVEGTGRADGTAPRETSIYRPILETHWHVLGEDRLIYASNWPVSARFAPYATVQGIATDFFEPLGRNVVAKVFRKNAERWYGVRLP
jgi:L-fuconolactonase